MKNPKLTKKNFPIFYDFRTLRNFRKSKIFFHQDEKIFFLRIFFYVLVCTSSTQKVHLEHPQCLQSDAKQRIIMCIFQKIRNSSRKNPRILQSQHIWTSPNLKQ